ncbi:MAG: Asp23/Gls24 family envelope stress response protein, partial [Klenkia sp.]|nr:Asp23/Gls24 family envelope stress response protein [Klenkia sp.]
MTGAVRELACGCSLDDLLAQVADGADPADPDHQRACPHCRAALAELAGLWAPVRELAETAPATPAGLDAKVMERVGAMATHAWHAVLPETDGVTRVAAWVVAVVA